MFKSILATILLSSSSLAQQVVSPDIVESLAVEKNFILNPSALKNTRGTVVSSAVLTRDTDSGDRLDGVASFNCDTSALNGFCEHDTVTITAPATVGNCEASMVYKGDGTLYSMRLTDGTNTLVERSLANVSDWTRVTLNYPCGATRDVRIVQTTAGTSPAINYGKISYGPARNIGSVAQATFVGGMEQVGATGCDYFQNTSSGLSNFITLGGATGCNAWTVTSNGPGTISAVGTNDHRLNYTNMPAGNYRIVLTGGFRNSVAGNCIFRLTDGTNNFQNNFVGSNASNVTVPALSFDVPYTTAATRTLSVQASDDFTGACSWINGNSAQNVSWKIYRFPTAEEQVYRPDQVAWRVDANIAGANPSLGVANVTTYTGITNGSLTLTNNSGAGVIPAQIACSGANPPTGTTCAAGDESIGISFVVPSAGSVLACANINHVAAANSGSGVSSAFQIVETPNNAQTILQLGNVRLFNGSGTQGGNQSSAIRVCGNLTFASAGQKTIRLFYEQAITGTPTASDILADGATTAGERDIKWEVYPLNYYQPAPLLIGSVVSGSTGIMRTEAAFVTSGGVVTEAGASDWINGNCSASNPYTCTFTAGYFSATPVCFANFGQSAAGTISGAGVVQVTDQTSASVIVRTFNTAFSTANLPFVLHCTGPR